MRFTTACTVSICGIGPICDTLCLQLVIGISVGVIVLLAVVITVIVMWKRGKLRCNRSRPLAKSQSGAIHTTVVNVGVTNLALFDGYSEIPRDAGGYTPTPTASPTPSSSARHDDPDYLHLPTSALAAAL